MPVMLVVAMGVAVLKRLVRVNVLVRLSQVQPKTCAHQRQPPPRTVLLVALARGFGT